MSAAEGVTFEGQGIPEFEARFIGGKISGLGAKLIGGDGQGLLGLFGMGVDSPELSATLFGGEGPGLRRWASGGGEASPDDETESTRPRDEVMEQETIFSLNTKLINIICFVHN